MSAAAEKELDEMGIGTEFHDAGCKVWTKSGALQHFPGGGWCMPVSCEMVSSRGTRGTMDGFITNQNWKSWHLARWCNKVDRKGPGRRVIP